MKNKLLRYLLVMQMVLLGVMMISTPASAADLRGYENIIIASGDVVNDDLYLAGDRIVINGRVNGDVLAAGSNIIINGFIDGDLFAIASMVDIEGEVTGSVRAAGGDVKLGGTVGEDFIAASGNIDIRNEAGIGRDFIFGAGAVLMKSPVGDDILGAADSVDLANTVNGNSELYVGRLNVTSTAHIKGHLIYTSEDEAHIDEGAIVEGEVTHLIPENDSKKFEQEFLPALKVWTKIIAYLMVLLLGIVLVLIAPRKSAEVVGMIRKKSLLSLGWGALVFFVAPIAILIVCLTVIGIPIGIIAASIYALLILISQLVVGLFIGHWILTYFNVEENRGTLIGGLFIGFTALTLLKLIPWVGFILWWATVLFGIGAIIVTLIAERNNNGNAVNVTESS